MSIDDSIKVVEALRAAGVRVDDVWDLANRSSVCREAIPVLLDQLTQVSDFKVKEGIVRALAGKEARRAEVFPYLLQELKELAPKPGSKYLSWAIGNTLSVIAEPSDRKEFGKLVNLLNDRRLGTGRQMLTEALAKIKHPDAAQALIELLSDEDIKGHAIFALGELRAPEAANYIEPFLKSENAWLRKEARRALSKIKRAR